MRRRAVVAAMALLVGLGAMTAALARPGASAATVGAVDWPSFHGNAARTGWNANETVLTPAALSGGSFGPLWNSPVLDGATVNGTAQPPHIYASPLYIDNVLITTGQYTGARFGVVFAATGAGWVYAIKAFDVGATNVAPGTILWKHFLGTPSAGPDGGVALGVLGTPVIDTAASPPRMYVASDVTDANGRNWQAFALDLGSGAVLPGWPLLMNNATLGPINANGPATFQPPAAMSQRGALNISPDGGIVYVPFGAYGDGGVGWLVAIDTRTPRLASSYSGAPSNVAFANGGMWGSGGPAVDAAGNVFDATGNSPNGSGPAAGTWGNSVVEWHPGTPLALEGSYSPWNYCQMDQFDTDLGGSSPVVVPALAAGTTTTPDLLAFGGKQGNAYILNRDQLPGSVTQRPPCSSDSSTDRSLLPPGNQPQFGRPGPLNVFGPYSEDAYNQTDYAKARTTPAYFRAADGTTYLWFSGSTKVAVGQKNVQPPSLARVKVVTAPGQPAYLGVDGLDTQMDYLSPGSPIVTSNGASNAIVWVLDANVFRTAALTGSGVPHPVLYAVDASTMKVLWSSTQAMLDVGGKYNTPVVSRGVVMVGTDRIQAFGVGRPQPTPTPGPTTTTVDDAVQGTGQNQFHYVGSWGHCTSGCIVNSYQGTVSYTDARNAYATFSFIGTQAKLYTSEKNNRGIGGVSIDGGTETTVDMYSPSEAGNILVYTSPPLSAGTHVLKVRNTGARNSRSTGNRVAIDRVDVLNPPVGHAPPTKAPAAVATVVPQTLRTVDDAATAELTYVGAWSHCNAGCTAGANHATTSVSTAADARVTLVFSGTQVRVHALTGPAGGITGISVDGRTEAVVDLYSPVPTSALVWTSAVLPPGTHVLQVRNTGAQGPDSSGTQVGLDSIEVVTTVQD